MDRVYLKTQAKSHIKGKIGILFLITLIIGIITAAASLVLSMIPGGSLIASIIITPAFTLSVTRVYLNLTVGADPEAKDAFGGFDDFWSAFKVQFLVGLFTFLWSLLFVIPGIVKSYSYSMSMYVLAENKGMAALDCISTSKQLMEGHKMELFVLQLSFIGWMLLVPFTLGLLLIWLAPYMNATYAAFYRELTNSSDTVVTEVNEAI